VQVVTLCVISTADVHATKLDKLVASASTERIRHHDALRRCVPSLNVRLKCHKARNDGFDDIGLIVYTARRNGIWPLQDYVRYVAVRSNLARPSAFIWT